MTADGQCVPIDPGATRPHIICMKSSDNCGVCGEPLIYGTKEIERQCAFCGETYSGLIYCPHGHYVCDACHAGDAVETLRRVLQTTRSRDPVEILETVMSHPKVPMHGPEHHAMVPAIIVAAARNTAGPVPPEAIDKAIDRGAKVPGGWCGFYGACGAAVGVGVAVSVLTGATPVKGATRTLANKATAFALQRIADGGPRCCKRASRMAIEAAVEFLDTHLGITLECGADIRCVYADRNRECIREACAYFAGN